MRGKKGLDFIDWSISMGIFIIAITALFVFLKPGARPQQDQDTLVTIVEQKFLGRAQWLVHETPIFMQQFQDRYGAGSEVLVDVRANGDMRFTAVRPSTHARYNPITRTGTRITFNCNADCSGTNFIIIGTTLRSSDTLDLEAECTPPNLPAACTAVLGATITHQGLRQAEIDALRAEDYNALKRAWTYPLQREFAIYQEGTKIIGGQEPVQQADVFVKELKMNRINDQGIQTPTIINIRVW